MGSGKKRNNLQLESCLDTIKPFFHGAALLIGSRGVGLRRKGYEGGVWTPNLLHVKGFDGLALFSPAVFRGWNLARRALEGDYSDY